MQRDIWIHQHPPNCSDPSLRFLVADWERLPGFGIGAQLAGMAGLLAIAIKEKRILVTNYYNRLITMVAMVIVLSALWILI